MGLIGNLLQKYGWLIPVLLATVIYLPLMHAPLFEYADLGNTIHNPWTRLPFLSAVQNIFTEFKPKFTYQPWVYLSFWIEFQIGKGHSSVFHFVSLFWHLLNIALLGLLLRRLCIPSPFRWLLLCIPALHPLAMESVAWVSNRGFLMCTGFMLMSLHLWFMADGRYKVWALGLAFMSAITHPIAMSLAAILFLLEFRNAYLSGKTPHNLLQSVMPTALITFLPFVYILYLRIKWMPKGLEHYNVSEAIIVQLSYWTETMHIFLRQFIIAEVPVIEYALSSQGNFTVYLVAAILILILQGIFIIQQKRMPTLGLILLGFLVFTFVFFIQLHIYPYDAPLVTDRYFYPALFVMSLFLVLCEDVFSIGSAYGYLGYGILSLLVVGWMFQLQQQLPAWQNSRSVWEASIRNQPKALKPYRTIYEVHDEDRPVDSAILAIMHQGLQYHPNDFYMHHIIGRYWFGKAQYDSAAWYFTNAIIDESGHARSYAYLARIAWLRNDSNAYQSHKRLAEFHGYKGILESEFIDRKYGALEQE